MRYFRDAARSLYRSPGLALAAIVCIALGSAAANGVATLVDAALLRPLPFPHAERLVRIWLAEAGGDPSLSIPEARELETLGSFEKFLTTARVRAVVLFKDGAQRLRGEAVNDGYFDALGIRAAHGRLLDPEDHSPGASRAIVLSYGTWIRGFGGDTGVIGTTLRTERAAYTVVGITPRDFSGTVEQDVVDFWIPLDQYEPSSMIRNRTIRQSWTIARLKAGTSAEAAQSELDAIQSKWAATYPEMYRQRQLRIEPFGESWRAGFRPGVGAMAVAAGLLLAIAAMNVGCPLIARVLERRRELAVRAALGADRRRMAMLLASEALIIVIIGGGLGLLAGPRLLDAFLAASPVALPSYLKVAPENTTLLAGIAVLAAAAMLAGTVPALIGGRVGPGEVLKEGSRGNVGRGAERRWVGILIGAEVALTLMLLVSGGLLVRAYERFSSVDLGYRREGLVRLAVTFSRADAGEPSARYGLFERIRDAVGAYPGVERAALVYPTLPPWDGYRARIAFTGLDRLRAPDGLEAGTHLADDQLLPALGVSLLAGRNFAQGDQRVAVISTSFAAMMGGAEQALGLDVEFLGEDPSMPSGTFRVVGVADDVAYDGLREESAARQVGEGGDRRGGRLDVYVPLPLFPVTTISIAALTNLDAAWLVEPLQREIARIAPTSAVHWTGTVSAEVGLGYAPTRFYALLAGTFSASALALTSVGLFALLSHAATRRTSEMGIRLALGATPRQVALLVMRAEVMPLLVGGVLGLLGSTWVATAMRALLYDVGSFDARVFATAVLAMSAVGLGASLIPARRVALVDPAGVMKAD